VPLLILAAIVSVLLFRRWSAQRALPGEKRVVLMTGADSGIGLGSVKALTERGYAVYAFCLTEDGTIRAAEAGAEATWAFDLTVDAELHRAVDEVLARCEGKLWGVVHCAGIAQPGFAEYQPMRSYRRVMDVNFMAPVALTQRLIPALKESAGRLVFVSSVDGIVSLPGNAPYDASKFAIEAYADALRAELSFWHIGVSVINPSTLKTPLAMNFFEGHRKTWADMEREDPNGPWKRAYPADWLDSYVVTNTERLHQIAQPPEHAVRDITHAVSSAKPKHRYLSGIMAKTLFWALWKMPEPWATAFKIRTIEPPPRTTR